MTAITPATQDFSSLRRAAARTLFVVALTITALGLLLGVVNNDLTIVALVAVLGWTQLVGI